MPGGLGSRKGPRKAPSRASATGGEARTPPTTPGPSVEAIADTAALAAVQARTLEETAKCYADLDRRSAEHHEAVESASAEHVTKLAQAVAVPPALQRINAAAGRKATRIGRRGRDELERIWNSARTDASATAKTATHDGAFEALESSLGTSFQENVYPNFGFWAGLGGAAGVILGAMARSPGAAMVLCLVGAGVAVASRDSVIGGTGLASFRQAAKVVGTAEKTYVDVSTLRTKAENDRWSTQQHSLDEAWRGLERQAGDDMAGLQDQWSSVGRSIEAALPGWSAMPSDARRLASGLRLGVLQTRHSLISAEMPLVWDFPAARHLAVRGAGDSAAPALVDLLAQMMNAPPKGGVEFELLDPTGLGRTFSMFSHLSDVARGAARVEVASTKEGISASLSRTAAHIETVNTNFLRGTHADLRAHNESSSYGVPYRVIVAHGLPSGLDDGAFEELLRIAKNGPRCGVYIICSWAGGETGMPYGHTEDELLHFCDVLESSDSAVYGPDGTSTGSTRTMQLTAPSFRAAAALSVAPNDLIDSTISGGLDSTQLGRVLLAYAAGARERASTVMNTAELLERYDESVKATKERFPFATGGVRADDDSTWWRETSLNRLTVPIGRKGASDFRAIDLGGEIDGHHVLVGGTTGSGKSTLLHVMVASMTMLYGPDELRLYMLDMKDGVGFTIYGQHGALPHVDVLGVHCPPDYVLAALEGLVGEMHSRNRKFSEETEKSGRGIDDIAAYRNSTGEVLPRVVCIVDEFQDLFAEDRRAERANTLLGEIAKKGRSTGIHLILATQSYKKLGFSSDSMGQFGTRIALRMADKDDSESLIGRGGAEDLHEVGAAIIRSTGYEPCQIGYVDKDDDIPALVKAGAAKASGRRKDLRVFDGRQSPRLLDSVPVRELLGLPTRSLKSPSGSTPRPETTPRDSASPSSRPVSGSKLGRATPPSSASPPPPEAAKVDRPKRGGGLGRRGRK
jgi:hypothetical protein